MQAQALIAVAFLAFLSVCGTLMALSVRRGRELCDELALRLPEHYVELGRPRPGFFESPRRQAYLRFVLQRQYATLADPWLVDRFDALRRSEMRQLGLLLAGLLGLGAAAVWYELLREG